MTGKELYALYTQASREAENCSVDKWADICDRPSWNRLAELLERSHPTSAEAKQNG